MSTLDTATLASSPRRVRPRSPSLAGAPVADFDSALQALADAQKLLAAQQRRIAYLESLAMTDELTGLVNRRALVQTLGRELAALRRDRGASGVLVLVDLDGFKAINDQHGHPAGDAYLVATAQALTALVRPSDVVARLGGDEFAVLLCRTAIEPGMQRAADLHGEFNMRWMPWQGRRLMLRASMGIAPFAMQDSADAVLAAADIALYANKQKRHADRLVAG